MSIIHQHTFATIYLISQAIFSIGKWSSIHQTNSFPVSKMHYKYTH